MDPNTTTRERFTEGMLNNPVPSDATTEWKEYDTRIKHLFRALAYHEAIIYFMWDFVGRTLGMLVQVDPKTSSSTARGKNKEAWGDVISRSVMTANLLLDSSPGMLNIMVESTYPGQAGKHPELGEDVLEAARKLNALGST